VAVIGMWMLPIQWRIAARKERFDDILAAMLRGQWQMIATLEVLMRWRGVTPRDDDDDDNGTTTVIITPRRRQPPPWRLARKHWRV
jgi:hypothetical protein